MPTFHLDSDPDIIVIFIIVHKFTWDYTDKSLILPHPQDLPVMIFSLHHLSYRLPSLLEFGSGSGYGSMSQYDEAGSGSGKIMQLLFCIHELLCAGN